MQNFCIHNLTLKSIIQMNNFLFNEALNLKIIWNPTERHWQSKIFYIFQMNVLKTIQLILDILLTYFPKCKLIWYFLQHLHTNIKNFLRCHRKPSLDVSAIRAMQYMHNILTYMCILRFLNIITLNMLHYIQISFLLIAAILVHLINF